MNKDIMNNKELTELKIEQPDNMEAIEHAFDEVIKDLILLREHVTGFEDARKYDPKHTAGTVPFETTPPNDEIKREAELKIIADIKLGIQSNVIKHPQSADVLNAVISALDDVTASLTQKENNE